MTQTCRLEPSGVSPPARPWSGLAGEWGGDGMNLGTGQLGGASWGGGPSVTGLQKGGGAQRGLCTDSEKKFTYFCFAQSWPEFFN